MPGVVAVPWTKVTPLMLAPVSGSRRLTNLSMWTPDVTVPVVTVASPSMWQTMQSRSLTVKAPERLCDQPVALVNSPVMARRTGDVPTELAWQPVQELPDCSTLPLMWVVTLTEVGV